MEKIFFEGPGTRAEGQGLRAEGQGTRDATDAAAKGNGLPRIRDPRTTKRNCGFIAEVMDPMEGWKRGEGRLSNRIYKGQNYWKKSE